MHTVRLLIVLFFLVAVPAAAIVDALHPELRDQWMTGAATTTAATVKNEAAGATRLRTTAASQSMPALSVTAADVDARWNHAAELSRTPPTEAPLAAVPPPVVLSSEVRPASQAGVAGIASRLRLHGAENIAVEEAPGASGGYRCYCEMRLPGHANYARPFEATAADPLAAASSVLRDVETWLAKQARPNTSTPEISGLERRWR